MTHLLPRFTEPPRLCGAEEERWNELAALEADMRAIETTKDRLERRYDLAIPAEVASACDRLDEAGDLLGKRRNALEDGDA